MLRGRIAARSMFCSEDNSASEMCGRLCGKGVILTEAEGEDSGSKSALSTFASLEVRVVAAIILKDGGNVRETQLVKYSEDTALSSQECGVRPFSSSSLFFVQRYPA